MHYSKAVKSMLFASINELASDPEKYAVQPGKHFTRYRKIGFKDLLLMLLTMEADSIKKNFIATLGVPQTPLRKQLFINKEKSCMTMHCVGYFLVLIKSVRNVFMPGNTR